MAVEVFCGGGLCVRSLITVTFDLFVCGGLWVLCLYLECSSRSPSLCGIVCCL